MLRGFIRIMATAMGCVLLLAGCSPLAVDPARDNAIEFRAESMLLRNDATKTSGRMVGTDFQQGDSFYAWAWHDAVSQFMTFNPVVKGAIDWDYDSHLYWNWRGTGDYYDFLALYPASSIHTEYLTPPSPTAQTQTSRLLKATVDYEAYTGGNDPQAGQYDLMAAGYRRDENGLVTPVALTFRRLLSAVCVDVRYADASLNPITLKSCHFVNLVTHSTVSATFNGSNSNSGLNIDTGVPSRSNDAVLGPSISANTSLLPGHSLYLDRLVSVLSSLSQDEDLVLTLAGDVYSDKVWNMTAAERTAWAAEWVADNSEISGLAAALSNLSDPEDWDLMIPQNLNPSGVTAPTIEVVYNDGVSDISLPPVSLKDIKNQSNLAITSWEAGVKYHYVIELRIGAGVVVTVKTTPWDIVEAETPGLMID